MEVELQMQECSFKPELNNKFNQDLEEQGKLPQQSIKARSIQDAFELKTRLMSLKNKE